LHFAIETFKNVFSIEKSSDKLISGCVLWDKGKVLVLRWRIWHAERVYLPAQEPSVASTD